MFNHAKCAAVIGGIAIATMATMSHAATPAEPSDSSPFVSPKSFVANPKVYGKTYGEWAAEWWKWALSFPDGRNPVQDETGEFCKLGQAGPVWFLAGSFGVTGVERKCTIPAGKAIFYPLVNAFWIDEPGDEKYTDEEVRWIVTTFTVAGDGACQLTSTLDTFNTPNFGELPAPVTALLQPVVRAQTPKFSINLPEGNILGFDPGPNERLIGEGYWAMLPPLTPGEHVLTLHGAGCVPTGEKTACQTDPEKKCEVLTKEFETEVTYRLTVVPGRRP